MTPYSGIASHFCDPLDPFRSLQLNNRYWKDDTFRYLDVLREADDDVNNLRLGSLRTSLKAVKALLPPEYHKSLVSRLVYSMVSRIAFDPVRFTLRLSDEFVRVNSYEGPDSEAYRVAKRTEEVKYVVDLVRSIYRDKYGNDIMSSDFQIRYMSSANAKRVEEMTRHGDFSDFHFDQYTELTCIIYLSCVDRDNGCFSYIDGISSLHKSHLLRALHAVVGYDMNMSYPEQTSHLPLELRGSMRLGDFLDDDKRARLRTAQVDVLGDIGSGIIFNGFETLHRGGKPLVGHRTSLVIATGGRLRLKMKRHAYQLLARLWL